MKKRGDVIFWGVVLVALGIILLIGNLFNNEVWGNIGNVWPLILIAIGVRMLFSRSSFVGGLILTAVGVIFLVDNFTGVDVWDQIWRFWPLILIAVGIDILYKYLRRRRTGVEVVDDSI